MGQVHHFRRLRWGPPRKLPTPDFLRERKRPFRPRRRGLSPWFAVLAVAAVSVVALVLPEVEWFWSRADYRPFEIAVIAIDGDTLRAGAERIRLVGIDAPELHQSCTDEDGSAWDCGREAQARLADLVAADDVACARRGYDIYGRTLAVCATPDVPDIGRALVREGLAVTAFGNPYLVSETIARVAGRGIWRGTFERPQDWRRQQAYRVER